MASKPKRQCLANDDEVDICWLKIFQYLKDEDLCEAARVSKKFKKLARKSFAERYETKTFSNQPFPYALRAVLCNFGDLMKSMSLRDRGLIFDIELEGVLKYCTETLEELDLGINAPIDRDLEDLAKIMFSSPKKLSIPWEYFGQFIDSCKELKSLFVYGSEKSDLAHAQNIPKLEELEIISNVELILTLLRFNPQIKKLRMSVDMSFPYKGSSSSELTFQRNLHDCIEVLRTLQLNFLEVAECHRGEDENLEFLPALEGMKIQHLKWSNVPRKLENLVDTILKLKTLKSLALTLIKSPFDNFLMKIGTELPLLEKLDLEFHHDRKEEPHFLRIFDIERFIEKEGKPHFSTGAIKQFIENTPKLTDLAIKTNICNYSYQQLFYENVF